MFSNWTELVYMYRCNCIHCTAILENSRVCPLDTPQWACEPSQSSALKRFQNIVTRISSSALRHCNVVNFSVCSRYSQKLPNCWAKANIYWLCRLCTAESKYWNDALNIFSQYCPGTSVVHTFHRYAYVHATWRPTISHFIGTRMYTWHEDQP